jgi:hypothetical protein
MNVPIQAVITGGMLIAAGLVSYTTGTPDPDTDKVSPTALIPAAFGGLLDLCGALSLALPHLRKHLMHAAATVGLLGFLGGFMPIVRGLSKTGTVDFGKPAVIVGVLMSGLCLAFVIACVKSFIDARKAREAAAAAT